MDDESTSAATPLAKPLSVGEAENIAVCIRVRPLNEREMRSRDCNVLRTLAAHNAISITDVDGAPLAGKQHVYQYDHIFDETRSTRFMYRHVAQRIVRSTLEGINGTIFAYGQTSSGKTYTMQGTADSSPSGSAGARSGSAPEEDADAGILQLAVADIFAYIERCGDRDFLLRVSFVEIYNEVVRDLLTPTTGSDRTGSTGGLKVREDPRKGVYVECKEEIITSYDDILTLLALGNQRRTVGQTAMNERSSRSHSIFRIIIESKQRRGDTAHGGGRRQSDEADDADDDDDGSGAVLVACLSLVDLAGSESVRHTAAEGLRQREAGNINKSLLTLSRVINALASASTASSSSSSSSSAGGSGMSSGPSQQASSAPPFRDSKLTRLLQNSLDGNTRTLIVCCVTPSDRFVDETKSTLQFAARAKTLQTSASVNEVLDDQAQLKRVQRELRELKTRVSSAAFDALRAENEELQQEMQRRKDEHARLMRLVLTSTARALEMSPGIDSHRQRTKPRKKRARETWCPGDFAAQQPALLAAVAPLSPNKQPRKRWSHSDDVKENVGPLVHATDGGEPIEDGDDKKNNELALLHVVELAVQSYRGDASEQVLQDAVARLHDRVLTTDDGRERLTGLLQELAALGDARAHADHVCGQNELLAMEVEELHRRMGRLGGSVETVESLRMELAEAQQVQHTMSEQLEALRADAVAVQATHEAEKQTLTVAMAALEQQLQQTAKYHAELEAQVQFLAEEKRALAATVAALESELAERALQPQAPVSGSDADTDAGLAAELQTLLQDAAKLQFELEAATADNRSLVAARDATAAELERQRLALKFAANEKQASAVNLQDLSDERAQLAEALRSIQAEMDQVLGESVRKAEQLELEAAALRAAQDATGDEMARLKAKLVELDDDKQTLLATIATLEAQQSSERDDNSMQEAQTRLSLRVEELETRLGTQRADADADQELIAKLSAELAEYETTVAAQATAVEQLRAELLLGDEEHATLRRRIDEFEHTVVSDQSHVQEAEPRSADTGEASADEPSELRRRIAALEEANATVTAELDTVAGQRRELFEELSALESQLMDESEEKTRLRAAVDALEQRVRESGTSSELANELARAKHAESLLLNELETLTAAMEQLEAANKSVQPPQATSDSTPDDDESVDALRQRLELEAELRATLELDVKSYEDTLQVVRNELRESSDSITELLEKLKAMEGDLRTLSDAKEQAEKDAAAAHALAQRAKEEEHELRFQSQQRALAFEQQLQDAHRTLESQSETHHALEAATQARSRLEKTVADLQDELVASRTQADASEARLADAEQHVARLSQELEQRSDELAAALSACSALEQQSEALDAKWRAKETELRQQVTAELASVRHASSDLAAQNAALEAQVRTTDAQWRAKEQALSQQVTAEMDSLREQYQEAQEELDAYQKYADDEIHKLRASVEASDVETELSRTRVDELTAQLTDVIAERTALDAKLQELLSARDEAVEHLQHELREQKAAVETLEGDAYRQRDELEDLSEALRSAQLEALHYQKELADVQQSQAELTTLTETQRQRIDKLEKVKMTTETLELFRKLKSDRAELQAKAQRRETELQTTRERIDELERAVEAERERVVAKETAIAAIERTLQDERSVHAQARAKAATESVAYLEKENLELLVENRQLKKRLESRVGDAIAFRSLEDDALDVDPSAAAAAAVLGVRPTNGTGTGGGGEKQSASGFLLGSLAGSSRADEDKEEEEEDEARPACAQQ